MKRAMAVVLAFLVCFFLCSCAGECDCGCEYCCGNETQAATKEIPADAPAEIVEENDENVIKFDPPVVVAEDEYVRVELVRFYQDHRLWAANGYPKVVDAATEGSKSEKSVVFRFYNKTDHALSIRMSDIYLGSEGADYFQTDNSANDTAAGKNALGHFLIRTGEKENLASMEELYSLDGDFHIYHKGDDGVLRNGYDLKFSIPNAVVKEGGEGAPSAADPQAWKAFRDYLQEHGPVTVKTEENENGYRQVTIEEAAGVIQISYDQEASVQYETAAAMGRSHMQFHLPANVKNINVKMKYVNVGADTSGGTGIQSCEPEFTWDIQSYYSGKELKFTTDYEMVDKDGNSIKEEGTVMNVNVTQQLTLIADVLSQTVQESGLGITMTDLGFIQY